MSRALSLLHVFALGVWVGSMVFFSLVAAPHLFEVFPRKLAGDITGSLFERYYLFGLVCAAVALFTMLLEAPRRPLFSILRVQWYLRLGVLMVLMMLVYYNTSTVRLAVAEARIQMHNTQVGDLAEQEQERFRRLHALSMILNMTTLLGAGLLTVLAGFAPPPEE